MVNNKKMTKYQIEVENDLEAFVKEYLPEMPIEKAIVRLLELLREKIDYENERV